MTLDFSIDDLTYRDLVDIALRRIPSASRGNWTLHAPVDPGITLVELFAWLLEQRSYWADRATPELVRAVLAMLGDAPLGPRAAGVALTFEPTAHTDVPKGSTLRVPETDLVFTLGSDVHALALVRDHGMPVIRLVTTTDRSEDLRTGRPVSLLAASGGAASAEIELYFTGPLQATTAPIAILFVLDTRVLPEWHPDAVDAKPAATLAWEYRDSTGAWQPLPSLRDGTLGLRRSGVVSFALPPAWNGSLRVSTQRSAFASPPTVLRIIPNTALATHVEFRQQAADPGWPQPLPRRAIQLPGDALPLPDSVAIQIADRSGLVKWSIVPDFTRSGPGDRVAVVDRTRSRIVFGDGLAGRMPRPDPKASPQVIVSYTAGGGDRGNVPPGVWEGVTGVLPSARTYVGAVGGRDAERLDDSRLRVAAALREPTRAVTPDDYARIATNTPGVDVGRAHAEVGLLLGECGVVPGVTTVFVVPGPRNRTIDDVRAGTAVVALAADPGMLDAVRARLEAARLVGEIVYVVAARYHPASIRVTIAGAPADPSGVRKRVAAALRVFLDPLIGGEDRTGWEFGEPIRPTALLSVAQRAIGDRGDVKEVRVNGESCDDVPIKPYELVELRSASVVIEAASIAGVGLR